MGCWLVDCGQGADRSGDLGTVAVCETYARLAELESCFRDRGCRGGLGLDDFVAVYDDAVALGIDSARIRAAFLAVDLTNGAEVGGRSIVAFALEAVAQDRYLRPRERVHLRTILGHLMKELGDYRQAARYFDDAARRLRDIDPTLVLWPRSRAAGAYVLAGDTAKAIAVYREIEADTVGMTGEQRDTRLTVAYKSIAGLYWASGDSASAARAFRRMASPFQRAIAGKPRSFLIPSVREVLIAYALDRGDFAAASAEIDTLARSFPNFARIQRALLHSKAGRPHAAAASIAAVEYGSRADRLKYLPLLLSLAQETGDQTAALGYAREINAAAQQQASLMRRNIRRLASARIAGIELERRLQATATAEALDAARRRLLLAVAAGLLAVAGLSVTFLLARHRSGRRERTRLAAKVDEQTAALRDANARLAARVSELARFNFLLSHDLREPVRSIVSFASLARRHLGRPEAVSEDLAYVQAGGRQLMDLLEGIEALRLADERAARPVAFDAVAAVNERLRCWRQTCPALEASLAADTVTRLPVVTDRDALSRVLDVLLENAVRFAGESAPRVTVALGLREGGGVTVDVRDWGIGFDATHAGEVMEAFRRLNRREDFPGAGIGLALARRLLEASGGELACVRAEIGLGCTFRVSLPAVTAVAPTPPPPESPAFACAQEQSQ